MGGEFVGDDADFHIVTIGQAEMFFGRDVAEHGAAEPADHGGADAAGDVIIAGGDVCGERPERVEGGLAADFELLGHVDADLVHGHVAGAFDHDLAVSGPGALREFAQRFEFGELRFVVGVGDAAWAEAVAEAEAHVVGAHDVADVVEVGVEEAFLVMREAPFGHDGAAAADDAGDAFGGHRDVAQQDAGVDGEIIDALLGLLDQGVAEHLPAQVFGDAADFLQRLIDGDGADRDGGIAENPFAGVVDVVAGGEVHHGVGAPADRPDHFFDFFGDRGGDGRIADVGVDFHQEVAADGHGFEFGVVDVGGDDGAAAGDFGADEFGGDVIGDFGAEAFAVLDFGADFCQRLAAAEVFADGDIFHFGRDDAAAGVGDLRDSLTGFGAQGAHIGGGEGAERPGGGFGEYPIVFRLCLAAFIGFHIAAGANPGVAGAREAARDIDGDGGIGVGTGGVVDADVGLVGGGFELDFAQGHADVRVQGAGDVHLG